MKEITGKQKTKSKLLHRKTEVDKTITQNLQDIAKELYKFFISIGSKLAKKSPQHRKNILRFFDIS